MNVVGKVTVNMKPIRQILKAKGLTADGDVQRFHTQNVLRRIVKYIEYTAGPGMSVEEDTLSVRISAAEGNRLEVVDGALFVAPSAPGPVLNVATFPATAGLEITARQGAERVSGITGEDGRVALQVEALGDWAVSTAVDGTHFSASVDIPGEYAVDLNVTTISSVLNENSWETIANASVAGNAPNYWSVGDTKAITIQGTIGQEGAYNLAIDAFIIGFNHNAAVEGQNLIHFQIGKINNVDVALFSTKYDTKNQANGYFSMGSGNYNNKGWESSQMRTTVLGNNGTPANPAANTLMAALPADLRAVMRPCTKYSDNKGGGADTASYVTATTDYLFLLAEFEYRGVRKYANSAEKNHQLQYAYYKAGNPLNKHSHKATTGTANDWCRSVDANTTYAFCLNDVIYGASMANAYWPYSIAPGFCV